MGFFAQCKEPAVLAGLSLQRPPPSEGTKAQDSMQMLAAIHRSCSHMIASAPVLPATADLERISLRKRKKESKKTPANTTTLLRLKHWSEHRVLCGCPPTLSLVMRLHVTGSAAFFSPALSSRHQTRLAKDQRHSPSHAKCSG